MDPSHAELLDGLATQFVEKKWSVKAMHSALDWSNEKPTDQPDLYAKPRLMGLNHMRLTHYHARRNIRLTDTGGQLIREAVA